LPHHPERRILRTSAGAIALVICMIAWLANRQPTAACGSSALSDSSVHEIQPARVVVHPWLGRHHVYGIFVVPNQFRDRRYSAILAVHDFQAPLIRNLKRDRPYVDPTLSRPGHYLERAYVPTRVALRFLVSGRFGDLRTPCEWQLAFHDRYR
jgi:hypothetical protein